MNHKKLEKVLLSIKVLMLRFRTDSQGSWLSTVDLIETKVDEAILEFEAGGTFDCQYYVTCGSEENCARCPLTQEMRSKNDV